MQDERDNRGADAVEDRGDGLQGPEMNVERAERSHDHEVGKDERPTAGPSSPEATAEIGNVDTHLDREWPWQRLAQGNGFAHLFLCHPGALSDEFALHLA